MSFQFREKHRFVIKGLGEYEFDIDNVDAVAAIQQEFPKLMEQISLGDQLIKGYEKYCATLGAVDPNAKTTGELLENALNKDAMTEEQRHKMESMLLEINERTEDTLVACKGFIIGCLGEDAYTEIFGGQRGRYMQDHVDLCTALYADTMMQRDKAVREQIEKNKEAKKGQ